MKYIVLSTLFLFQIVRGNSQSAEELCNLGAASYNEGNYNMALLCLNRALEINPRCEECHYNLGLVQIEIGNLSEGCSSLKEAKRLGMKEAKHPLKDLCHIEFEKFNQLRLPIYNDSIVQCIINDINACKADRTNSIKIIKNERNNSFWIELTQPGVYYPLSVEVGQIEKISIKNSWMKNNVDIVIKSKNIETQDRIWKSYGNDELSISLTDTCKFSNAFIVAARMRYLSRNNLDYDLCGASLDIYDLIALQIQDSLGRKKDMEIRGFTYDENIKENDVNFAEYGRCVIDYNKKKDTKIYQENVSFSEGNTTPGAEDYIYYDLRDAQQWGKLEQSIKEVCSPMGKVEKDNVLWSVYLFNDNSRIAVKTCTLFVDQKGLDKVYQCVVYKWE